MQRYFLALMLAAQIASRQAMADTAAGQGLGTPAVSAPNTPQPLTLAEALRLAKANNPGLAGSRLSRDVAEGAAEQMRRWTNPELEFSSEDIPTGSGGLSAAQNMVGITQTIPYPGRKRLDAEIGNQSVAVAEHQDQGRERELVREVKTAFYRALAAAKRVAASEELLSLSQSLGDAAGRRVAAGEAGLQERVRAEIEIERGRVACAAARLALTESRLHLAALIGSPGGPLGPLQGALREHVPPPNLEALGAQMLAQHPDRLASLANRERAQLEMQRAQGAAMPDVTLGFAAGRSGEADEGVMEFRASLPLPLLNRAQGSKREAGALNEIARLAYSVTEQRLLEELAIAGARLSAAGEQADSYRTRILPKAEEALNLVRQGFEAGKFGFLDLVDTQRTAEESRLEYVDKVLELNIAIVELEALAGIELSE